MARVRTDRQRDAEPRGFGDSLQVIVLRSDHGGCTGRTRDGEAHIAILLQAMPDRLGTQLAGVQMGEIEFVTVAHWEAASRRAASP